MKNCNCKHKNCGCDDGLLKLMAIDIQQLKNIVEELESTNRKIYWNNILDKPELFPPSLHNHIINDIEGLRDILDSKTNQEFLLSNYYNRTIVDNKDKVLSDRIDDINLGVSGSITTTQTLPQLNALPDGIYEAQTSGVYTNGLTAKDGYYTKFKKEGTVWTLNSEIKMPSIDTSTLANASTERGGKNFVDLSKMVPKVYVNFSNGNYVTSDSPHVYNATGKIYIGDVSVITISHFNHYALYDENGIYISGKNAAGQSVNPDLPWTLQTNGAFYIDASIRDTLKNVFQIEEGTQSTTYEPFVPKKILVESQIPEIVRKKTEKIKPEDLSFSELESGRNKADPSKFTAGKYVNNLNGLLSDNADYYATDFIPVVAGKNYTLSHKHTLAWTSSTNPIDPGFYISGSTQFETNKTLTAPVGANFVRASIHKDNINTFQLEEGSIENPFEPFKEVIVLKNTVVEGTSEIDNKDISGVIKSIQGLPAKRITNPVLGNNTTFSTTDFPFHIKKNVGISASCKFTNISGKIIIGKGFNKYRGSWIEIDATNIVWKFYEASAEVRGTVAHGLILQDFLNVSIFLDDKSVCHIVLHTKNGMFKHTFQWSYEFNSEPFIRTEGQELTDVILTASTKDIRNSIWFFGDSYQSVTLDRWTGQLKEIGFFNVLINALAGQTSTNAVADLQRCLKYGTPKYLVWGLGMNDTDSSWESNLNIVKDICEDKGIELILCTIPSVPSRSKEYISNYVRSSGYRYIDFYTAVGAQPDGTWISGYQEPGGSQVHPTELGAKALAMRVLVDLPEVMQYGLI